LLKIVTFLPNVIEMEVIFGSLFQIKLFSITEERFKDIIYLKQKKKTILRSNIFLVSINHARLLHTMMNVIAAIQVHKKYLMKQTRMEI
jgi:hypothetical protein